ERASARRVSIRYQQTIPNKPSTATASSPMIAFFMPAALFLRGWNYNRQTLRSKKEEPRHSAAAPRLSLVTWCLMRQHRRRQLLGAGEPGGQLAHAGDDAVGRLDGPELEDLAAHVLVDDLPVFAEPVSPVSAVLELGRAVAVVMFHHQRQAALLQRVA